MRTYLHLAESGLALADISLRLYAGDGSTLDVPEDASLEPLASTTDYLLDGLPDDATNGMTATLESPAGVYHAIRFGLARTQPAGVVIPIREIFGDPEAALDVQVLQDGEAFASITVDSLAVDGEYFISGWETPAPRDELWSVRWVHEGVVYAVTWEGNAPAAMRVEVTAIAGTAQPAVVAIGNPESIVLVEAVEVP